MPVNPSTPAIREMIANKMASLSMTSSYFGLWPPAGRRLLYPTLLWDVWQYAFAGKTLDRRHALRPEMPGRQGRQATRPAKTVVLPRRPSEGMGGPAGRVFCRFYPSRQKTALFQALFSLIFCRFQRFFAIHKKSIIFSIPFPTRLCRLLIESKRQTF